MADFRRWFTVLAVLAIMVGAASAQVGVANGSSGGPLTCVATAAGTPELRPEGFTELVGDIVISCTGGSVQAQGSIIPTANIVIFTSPGVPITSRFLSSNGASEALLIVDEAGSNVATGVTGAFGPHAPQVLCSYAQEIDNGGANNKSSCTPLVGNDGNGYIVPVAGPGWSGPAANVFQGKLNDFGTNSVSFYNVPVLPPATTGVSRVFRIVNVRIPIAGQNLAANTVISATISTSPSGVLPLVGTPINIGTVGTPLGATVATATTFQQCTTTTRVLSANITFTEGFATAFKTRVVPGGAGGANTLYAAEATNTAAPANQNIPGSNYLGYAANSESGFIFPSLTNTTGGTTYTAGLADFGTRLKAVFYNIPAGVTLYVTTSSAAQTAANFVVGGTSALPYAVLVSTSNTNDATPDGTAFAPVASTTTSNSPTSGIPLIALSAASNGTATAVWEVTNANPSAKDALTFGVYISYVPASPTTANPYGLPQLTSTTGGLPTGSILPGVNLSMAPEPGDGLFTAGVLQGTTLPIPRFAVTQTLGGPWTIIQLCQTTLLYPFVTGAAGFDTGIAVANTSWDPFKTPNQAGSCTLYAYGVTVGATANTAIQTVVPGCDTISNPVAGTNCFGVGGPTQQNYIPAGQVGSVMASAVLPGFQGYVIAICNFQYAHGYAAVTDLGLRNLWSSYLALELSPGGVGSPRAGISGIENLVH